MLNSSDATGLGRDTKAEDALKRKAATNFFTLVDNVSINVFVMLDCRKQCQRVHFCNCRFEKKKQKEDCKCN